MELTTRFDWSVQGAFDALDIYKEGRVSVDSLRTFLKVNGFLTTGREVDAIMRRLDSDSDYALSLSDLYDAFSLRHTAGKGLEFREEGGKGESLYMMMCDQSRK
jgi:hypothetical protein